MNIVGCAVGERFRKPRPLAQDARRTGHPAELCLAGQPGAAVSTRSLAAHGKSTGILRLRGHFGVTGFRSFDSCLEHVWQGFGRDSRLPPSLWWFVESLVLDQRPAGGGCPHVSYPSTC